MRSSAWLTIAVVGLGVTFGLVGCGDDDDDGGGGGGGGSKAGSASGGSSTAGKGGKSGGGTGNNTAGTDNESGSGPAPMGGETSSGGTPGETGGMPNEGGSTSEGGAGLGGANGAGGEGGAVAANTDVELHSNVFTDSEGFSLYIRVGDTVSTTAPVSGCTGGCLTVWPVFDVANPTVPAELSADDFRTFDRGGAVMQATYKGWPLYYFAGDVAPGTTSGDGSGGIWHVVKFPFVAP